MQYDVKIKQLNTAIEQISNDIAQMEKIMATGLPIDHLDSHQHLHVLPQIWSIVQSLMMKYGIHRLRIPREAYSYKVLSANPVRIAGRDGLTYLSRKAMTSVRRLHFTTTDFFCTISSTGYLLGPMKS